MTKFDTVAALAGVTPGALSVMETVTVPLVSGAVTGIVRR